MLPDQHRIHQEVSATQFHKVNKSVMPNSLMQEPIVAANTMKHLKQFFKGFVFSRDVVDENVIRVKFRKYAGLMRSNNNTWFKLFQIRVHATELLYITEKQQHTFRSEFLMTRHIKEHVTEHTFKDAMQKSMLWDELLQCPRQFTHSRRGDCFPVHAMPQAGGPDSLFQV
jgi:hypothetical protein